MKYVYRNIGAVTSKVFGQDVAALELTVDGCADSVQGILRFQQLTMQFMLQRVQETITACGLQVQPTDFLNFFCLGNRAAGPRTHGSAFGKNDCGVLSEDNRRFMVYVHSKFMIVDDEVAIIGVHLARSGSPYTQFWAFCERH
jgi:phosphatidylserine/phosphatidylglycerophosphate/cardiolipin synthase-like enzyme